MSGVPGAAPDVPDLAARLRGVKVGLRADLEIVRHVFQDEPCYVVRDPITFGTHAFSAEDYGVLVSIDASRTLGETFDVLVERGRLDRDREQEFYAFVLKLHRLGLLSLPVADDRALYARFREKRMRRLRSAAMSFLFLRVPLWNPDAFLLRTERWARPLFTRAAGVLWLLLMAIAGGIVATRWDELASPLVDVLAISNLPFMWGALVGLKVLHEFGHAYACRLRGGPVPEMGMILVIFTPCAYVDATSAWGFPRRRDRLLVSLAGMYVESIVGAFALMLWAATPPSALNSMAYQVVLLSSIVTVAFNLNPLMRFDGYYLLADLVNVPNLRQRAQQQLASLFNRFALGLPDPPPPGSRLLRLGLGAYGIASAVYKVLLVVSLSAVIAAKAWLVGLGLAGFYLVTTLVGAGGRAVRHLLLSPATAPVRRRAVTVTVAGLLLLGVGPLLVPLPAHAELDGIVGAERELVVRATVPGTVQRVEAEPGARLDADAVIVALASPAADAALAERQAELEFLDLRIRTDRVRDPRLADQALERRAALEADVAERAADRAALVVRAPEAGVVIASPHHGTAGAYLRAGDPVAHLASGAPRLRVLATADDLASARPLPGQVLVVRTTTDPDRDVRARVLRVERHGRHEIPHVAATSLAGGALVVDPRTGAAAEPYFEIELAPVDPADEARLRPGGTVRVRVPAEPATLLQRLERRVRRFMDEVRRKA